MQLRAPLNALALFFLAAVLASATGIPNHGPMTSVDIGLDRFGGESSDVPQLGSGVPLNGDAIKLSANSFAAPSIASSIDGTNDQTEKLTSELTAAELSIAEPAGNFRFLWMIGLSSLLAAAVGLANMIRHNRQNTTAVQVNRKCSGCFSTKTLSSRWRWYELHLWLFSARPIRCFSCQRRQFVWAWNCKQRYAKPAQNLVPAH